jgi:hypothetical protein
MGTPLPLYEGAKPCQRTGFCCEKGVCGFGTWDPEQGRCAELRYDRTGLAACARYEEILALPQAVWWASPAFGAGCCMPLNSRRKR